MENLKVLIALQKIDLQLDELKQMRGDLPDQIEDIEADLAGTKLKLKNAEKYLLESEVMIKNKELDIATAREKIEKYKAQQFEVRNNREYDALTKEVDAQTKGITDMEAKIVDIKKHQIESAKTKEVAEPKITSLEEELAEKKEQLKLMTQDTIEEEKMLMSDRKKILAKTDKLAVENYERVREARDGRAIVKLSRGACGGCFKVIPLQRQNEIKRATKIYHCEHCGRIIVPETFFDEVK